MSIWPRCYSMTWSVRMDQLVLSLIILFRIAFVLGFDENRNDNLAVYWGQNSNGDQQTLSYYCQDDVYNVIPLAFLYVFFGTGGEPMMSFADTCNEGNGTFPGTALSNCTFLASDIEYCQGKGKIITLSLGGADSSVGFTNESQAEDFADTVWNSFLGGDSDVRPFGKAVLDGIDLDIEGGLPTYYNKFVDKLRTYTDKADKTYYITAAPQCPFPDAYVGPAINQSRFDAIYVQFYNNYCGLNYPEQFDFSLWDTWARTQSPNPDVKIYIGAPGSATAAGQGYVSPEVLIQYALVAQTNYSTFGGVMLWDASDAYSNDRYDKKIKDALAEFGQDVDNGSSSTGTGGTGGTGTGQECFQDAFVTEGRNLIERDGMSDLYTKEQGTLHLLTSIIHHSFKRLSAKISGKDYVKAFRKYSLYRRSEL